MSESFIPAIPKNTNVARRCKLAPRRRRRRWRRDVAGVIGHTRSLFPNNNRRDAIKCYTIFI